VGVDIAVFETNEKRLNRSGLLQWARLEHRHRRLLSGSKVWFIGYPFGMSSVPAKDSTITSLPFMKRGSMSAIDASNPEAVVYYIDGNR
jgi:hypothetical protein